MDRTNFPVLMKMLDPSAVFVDDFSDSERRRRHRQTTMAVPCGSACLSLPCYFANSVCGTTAAVYLEATDNKYCLLCSNCAQRNLTPEQYAQCISVQQALNSSVDALNELTAALGKKGHASFHLQEACKVSGQLAQRATDIRQNIDSVFSTAHDTLASTKLAFQETCRQAQESFRQTQSSVDRSNEQARLCEFEAAIQQIVFMCEALRDPSLTVDGRSAGQAAVRRASRLARERWPDLWQTRSAVEPSVTFAPETESAAAKTRLIEQIGGFGTVVQCRRERTAATLNNLDHPSTSYGVRSAGIAWPRPPVVARPPAYCNVTRPPPVPEWSFGAAVGRTAQQQQPQPMHGFRPANITPVRHLAQPPVGRGARLGCAMISPRSAMMGELARMYVPHSHNRNQSTHQQAAASVRPPSLPAQLQATTGRKHSLTAGAAPLKLAIPTHEPLTPEATPSPARQAQEAVRTARELRRSIARGRSPDQDACEVSVGGAEENEIADDNVFYDLAAIEAVGGLPAADTENSSAAVDVVQDQEADAPLVQEQSFENGSPTADDSSTGDAAQLKVEMEEEYIDMSMPEPAPVATMAVPLEAASLTPAAATTRNVPAEATTVAAIITEQLRLRKLQMDRTLGLVPTQAGAHANPGALGLPDSDAASTGIGEMPKLEPEEAVSSMDLVTVSKSSSTGRKRKSPQRAEKGKKRKSGEQVDNAVSSSTDSEVFDCVTEDSEDTTVASTPIHALPVARESVPDPALSTKTASSEVQVQQSHLDEAILDVVSVSRTEQATASPSKAIASPDGEDASSSTGTSAKPCLDISSASPAGRDPAQRQPDSRSLPHSPSASSKLVAPTDEKTWRNTELKLHEPRSATVLPATTKEPATLSQATVPQLFQKLLPVHGRVIDEITLDSDDEVSDATAQTCSVSSSVQSVQMAAEAVAKQTEPSACSSSVAASRNMTTSVECKVCSESNDLRVARCRQCARCYHKRCHTPQWSKQERRAKQFVCTSCKLANLASQQSPTASQQRVIASLRRCETLLQVRQADDFKLFWEPVNLQAYPDYLELIQPGEPVDLRTVERRLPSYDDDRAFLADCLLIFENCRRANEDGTDIVVHAANVEASFKLIASEHFPAYEDLLRL